MDQSSPPQAAPAVEMPLAPGISKGTEEMLFASLIALSISVVLILSIHVYLRSRLRRHRHRHITATYYSYPTPTRPEPPHRLDRAVLLSLPVSVVSASDEAIGCAVCLSDVEEGEKVRILPRCLHGFHVDCIDMWFSSHATCPICRAAVETAVAPQATARSVLVGPSSNRADLMIEVPERRVDGFEDMDDELRSGLWTGSKSPITRMLSLRRILSRGRAIVAEPDLERGEAAVAAGSSSPQLATANGTSEMDKAPQ